MDLLEMDDDFIDHSPADGWCQKYVFFYTTYEKGHKEYMFCFANDHQHDGFKSKPMRLGGEFLDHHIWCNFEKMEKTKELVWTPGMTGREYVMGVWGVAYGHPVPKYVKNKKVGELMFWDQFYQLDMKSCKEFIKEQFRFVSAGVLDKRPHFTGNENNE